MVLSSDIKLIHGKIYFYEYRGEIAIGEFFEEATTGMSLGKYMHEFWCEGEHPNTSQGLMIDRLDERLNVLKELPHISHISEIPSLLKELRIEFPEYFL